MYTWVGVHDSGQAHKLKIGKENVSSFLCKYWATETLLLSFPWMEGGSGGGGK